MSKYADLANQYIEDVLKGRVDACKWVKLACKRHKKDLKNSSKRDYPYKFDIQKAEKPCKFIELLKHVKGPKAGENIVLEPWECFILCCIFGWVKKSNGFRRFKVAYIEVPRGNGKSLLCSELLFICYVLTVRPVLTFTALQPQETRRALYSMTHKQWQEAIRT